jgi:methionyl-tRNA formyltransferase
VSASGPSIVFVGVHREAERPFRWLLAEGEDVRGLVTLTPEAASKVSGAVDLRLPAREGGVPVLEVSNVNEPTAVSWTRAKEPDLLLVIGWTQLLKDELLGIPRIAALGFHASLLPKYRGRAPVNWALIHGEETTGNTMIVLAPGADEGDIVAQREIPIGYGDDCATLYDKVAATEVDMLAEVLPLVRGGRMPRRVQIATEATVMPKRRPEDGIIDWSRSTRDLYNWVRALTHPYPGAFTTIDGRRLWVWRALEGASKGKAGGDPTGMIATDEGGSPRVRTGDGWLELVRVQLDGEAEVDATRAGFLRPGARLGEPAGGGDR